MCVQVNGSHSKTLLASLKHWCETVKQTFFHPWRMILILTPFPPNFTAPWPSRRPSPELRRRWLFWMAKMAIGRLDCSKSCAVLWYWYVQVAKKPCIRFFSATYRLSFAKTTAKSCSQRETSKQRHLFRISGPFLSCSAISLSCASARSARFSPKKVGGCACISMFRSSCWNRRNWPIFL